MMIDSLCVCSWCLTTPSHIADDRRRRPSRPITLPNLDSRPSWPKNQTHLALFSLRPFYYQSTSMSTQRQTYRQEIDYVKTMTILGVEMSEMLNFDQHVN